MISIYLKDNPKEYQFSFDKFNIIYENWDREEHEGLSMGAFLSKYLLITKDCFYNYRHRRNGMVKENIEKLAELLSIPMEDLLEEKIKEREPIAMSSKVNNTKWSYNQISELSKTKIYETITAIDECIFAFFAVFEAEEEFFNVIESVRINAIAIPDELLAEIEDFVYGDLDKLISNPNDIFYKLPPISDTLEGTRERNKKLSELQDKFMLESFYPLKEKAKQYIITR